MVRNSGRRRYLGAVAATMVAIAGCSGSGDESSGGSGTTTSGSSTRTTGSSASSTTTSESSSQTSSGTGTDTTAETETSPQSSDSEGTLELLESELEVDEGEYYTDVTMTGLLENTGSGTLRIPEINVRFYDDNDSVLDSTSESIVFLEPGDRWDVSSLYLNDDVPARGEIVVESTEEFQTELGIPDELEVTEEDLETGTEPAIQATIQNTSDSTVDVAAFAVFYDGDGVALSDGLATLDGLASGESWSATLEPLLVEEERAERVADYTMYANIP